METPAPGKPGVFYRRILFCTDFSPNADYAFHYALASVRRSGDAQLHILHVLPEPDAQFWRTYLYEVDDVDAKATADINQKIKESYLEDVTDVKQVVISVTKGRPDEEILSYAKKIDADLLVMGRQGTSSFRLNIFGNVAEVIARKAECPVLIIPHRMEKKH
jgi:nucleotide-binding universal stress UspA family protein